ncbi:MAG: hypothetical protein R3D44_03325 [Hyphomicrobiaceae bacterium]
MISQGRGRSKNDAEKTADKAHQQNELDEALEATFPASDPVTTGHPTGDEPSQAPVERRAPLLDVELIKRLARKLKRETKTG